MYGISHTEALSGIWFLGCLSLRALRAHEGRGGQGGLGFRV